MFLCSFLVSLLLSDLHVFVLSLPIVSLFFFLVSFLLSDLLDFLFSFPSLLHFPCASPLLSASSVCPEFAFVFSSLVLPFALLSGPAIPLTFALVVMSQPWANQ